METPGQRIRKRRIELGLKQPDLTKYLKLKSKGTVSQWESDHSKPSGVNLTKLCQILKTTPDYILYGVLPGENDSSYSAEPNHVAENTEVAYLPPHKEIPIVSWVQAGERHVAYVEEDLDEIDTFTTYVKCSKASYALRVTGESMTSLTGSYSFPPGSIIVVDPEQKGDTADGIFVIAKENGNDAVTFKQLRYDGGRPYLNPLNPQYVKYFGEFRIIGKVVDFRPVKLP